MATKGKKILPAQANGLHIGIDNLTAFHKAIKRLARDEVLVGIPAEVTDRPFVLQQGKIAEQPTNATLAYIHDNGAPEARIPARPFFVPAMERSKEGVTKILAKAAQYGLALDPDQAKVEEGFNRVGQMVRDEMRNVIDAGIPPPLAELTLKKRAAKGRKGAQMELDRRAKGLPPGTDLAKPLLDTGEMAKSLTWVIRRKAARES